MARGLVLKEARSAIPPESIRKFTGFPDFFYFSSLVSEPGRSARFHL